MGKTGREAPPTSELDVELAARLRLAIARTARRLRQEAGTDLGPSQVAALATLEIHGPMSPSELADRERIKRPTATRILSHLGKAGLVERISDPSDGRSAIVSATVEGRALVRRLRQRKTAYLATRMRKLPDDDVRTLARAAQLLEQILEEDSTAEHRIAKRGGRA